MIKVAACQTSYIHEDIASSLRCIETFGKKGAGVDLLCFPECFLQGYLTEDRLARQHGIDLASPFFFETLARLRNIKPTLVIGMIEIENGKLYNTAVVIHNGLLVGKYRKVNLLDGERIFSPGTRFPVFEVSDLKFGINICYDTNFPTASIALADQGAHLIVCPSNNMMRRDKAEKFKPVHNEVRSRRCRETGLWLLSSDVTGEYGDRIGYGPTALINPKGAVVSQVPLLEEGIVIGEIR